MKDTKSILLGLLSIGLVLTWVYHLYDKTQYSTPITKVNKIDTLTVGKEIQDSLQKTYTHTINNLDAQLDSTKNTAGQLQNQLATKLKEINRLRTEISAILKKNDFTNEDLELARSKTVELQNLVADLQNKNSTVEEEKKQLNAVLENTNTVVKNLTGTVQKVEQENKILNEKVNAASSFVASELKLSPVAVKNEKEQETNQSKKASKLVISFAVQNNINDYENADVFIVITQPNGKVLRNEDVWETSTANLQNGSRINFTRKIRFEYQKGERKPIIFSLNPEEFLSGTYTLQVYHNGYMIGQSMKTLN